MWKTIGRIAVDSGQLMVVDPCYLNEWKDDEYDADKFQGKPGLSYNGACEAISNPMRAGMLAKREAGYGLATVFEAGLGDGIYEVQARYIDCGERTNKNKIKDIRIAEIKIKLI